MSWRKLQQEKEEKEEKVVEITLQHLNSFLPSGFFPYVVSTLRHIPIIGQLLTIPPFKQVCVII
jgi:hypothetical protein